MATTEPEHLHDADGARLAQRQDRAFSNFGICVEFAAGTGVVDEPAPAPAAAG